ncbi:MAG: response regulator transcription factor [Acetivibrionales bacterium]|jgi:two-component system response regulator YesN
MIKVIVADDEIRVCNLVCNLVDWASFNMKIAGTAHDGISAYELIEKEKPDLIITDIRMPGMDGLTLISKTKSICPEAEIIIISGYRDFEYAQNAIRYGVNDYLLKPIKKDELENTLLNMKNAWEKRVESINETEKLMGQLESDKGQLRGFFFRDVLLNSQEGHSLNMDDINQRYYFSFKEGLFQAFIIKFDFSSTDNYFESYTAVLKRKVEEILHRNLKPVCIDEECYVKHCWVYGIMNFEKSGIEAIRKQFLLIANEMISLKSMFHQVDLNVGLGSVHNDVNSIKESMENAIISVNHRLLAPACIRIFQNEKPGRLNNRKLLEDFKNSIITPVELLDVKAAEQAVIDLERKVMEEPEADGHAIYLFVPEAFNYFLHVLRTIHTVTDDQKQAFTRFKDISELCGSVKELFGYLRIGISDLLTTLFNERRQSVARPIRNAKQYIQENYMEPITLDTISAIAGFNSSYFSALFKKECGVSFVEYLSEVRIKKSKSLLKETDLSIAEICNMVGYQDIKHFNKTFKKISGVSPAEFRKLYS